MQKASEGISSKAQRVLLTATLLLPMLVAFLILYRTASRLPVLDDYPAILSYLLELEQRGSFMDKLGYMLTAQCGDYKLVFEHFVVSCQFLLLHQVSFRALVTIGNLFLLPILALLYRGCFPEEQDQRSKLTLFLPISFLLFSLNYAETLDWAMGALQNLPAIAFGLASILLLTRTTRSSFVAASGCAVLSCASSANGFLLAPIGVAMLLLGRRGYLRVISWVLTFAGALAVYLLHYVKAEDLSNSPLWKKCLFFLSFIGSAVENMHGWPVRHAGVAVGGLIFLVFCYAVWTRCDRPEPFAFFSFAWLLLNAALVSEVRISLGLAVSLSGRYKIYSNLMLIFCYVFVVHWVRSSQLLQRSAKTCYVFALSLAILICVGGDITGQKKLKERQALTNLGMERYERNPAAYSPVLFGIPPLDEANPHDRWNAGSVLAEALTKGIYVKPSR